MRFGISAACFVLAPALLVAPHAHARDAATGGQAAPKDVTEAARTHFKTGIKLYQDDNYEGALAEFVAAYELKPGPGSLQNIALCQKALFRYAEAADSLTRLLSHHAAELTAAERTAAEQARSELQALVGSVRLSVMPTDAAVTLDGRVLSPAERGPALRLNVGEHQLTATAPGYVSATKTFQVASGTREVPLELTLERAKTEPEAPVAVNPEPAAPAGAQASTVAAASAPSPPNNQPPARPAVGWYALGSASLLATSSTPFKFDLSNAHSGAWGLGVRAGRRLRPPIAVEGLVEFDLLRVHDACDEYATALLPNQVICGEPGQVLVDYLIRSLRFGPTLELMTTGQRLRAQGGIGFGAVWHDLRLGQNENDGVDPYLLLEIGMGANTKHALFVLQAQLLLDGTHNLIQSRSLGPGGTTEEQAFERSGGALAFVGLNLRVGYSEWAP